jgi:hypothetical protein
VGVGPPVHGRSRNMRACVRAYSLITCTRVHPKGEKRHALYACLLARQPRMAAQMYSGQVRYDAHLCM